MHPYVPTVAIAALVVATPLLAHDRPIVIGRDAASPPRLAFDGPHHILDGSESIELHPGDGDFAGMWIHDEPSFATLHMNEPESDFFRLLPGGSVSLRLVAFDAPLRFYEPIGFTPILETPGAIFTFPTDDHGDFNIHLLGGSTAPGNYAATFQFTDPSGVHLDSESFTIRFQTVPTPASAVLPLFMGIAASRRRRPRA